VAWADRSPLEQAALRFCAPRGIPLSVFLEQRVVYPGDPMWTEDDTQAVFDWQVHQNGLCDGCGQDTNDTFGPDHEEKWNAELSGHCDACRALHRAALTVADSDEQTPPTVGARYRMWRDEEDGD